MVNRLGYGSCFGIWFLGWVLVYDGYTRMPDQGSMLWAHGFLDMLFSGDDYSVRFRSRGLRRPEEKFYPEHLKALNQRTCLKSCSCSTAQMVQVPGYEGIRPQKPFEACFLGLSTSICWYLVLGFSACWQYTQSISPKTHTYTHQAGVKP